jgi:hypothetical protein
VLAPGDSLDRKQNIKLKPLRPKEGRFLPAGAALGAIVYLEPDGYQPTKHDTIRLSTNVHSMKKQQGYICCEPRANVSACRLCCTGVV